MCSIQFNIFNTINIFNTATLLSVQQIYRFCKQFEENNEYPTDLAILSLLNYCKEENDNRVVNDRVEMRARHTLSCFCADS